MDPTLDPNAPDRAVRLDDIRRLAVSAPLFRNDAAALWFQKELEQVIANQYERKYPEMKMSSGAMIPIRSTVPRGKKTGSYKMYDFVGVAKWLTTGSWKDIPKASVSAARATFSVHEFNLGYGWELGELEEAQATGTPLEQFEAQSVRMGMDKFLNDVGMYGDANKGIHGITNVPNMTVIDAAAGTGGAIRWSVTGGTAKTALEMVADIALAIRTMRSVTNQVHRPNRCWIPPSFWEATNRVVIANTAVTVRKYLADNYPDIAFDEVNELEDAGTNGVPCMIFAHLSSPDELWLEVPIPFEQHGPFQDGLSYGVATRESTGGVITPYPMALLRMDFA